MQALQQHLDTVNAATNSFAGAQAAGGATHRSGIQRWIQPGICGSGADPPTTLLVNGFHIWCYILFCNCHFVKLSFINLWYEKFKWWNNHRSWKSNSVHKFVMGAWGLCPCHKERSYWCDVRKLEGCYLANEWNSSIHHWILNQYEAGSICTSFERLYIHI